MKSSSLKRVFIKGRHLYTLFIYMCVINLASIQHLTNYMDFFLVFRMDGAKIFFLKGEMFFRRYEDEQKLLFNG